GGAVGEGFLLGAVQAAVDELQQRHGTVGLAYLVGDEVASEELHRLLGLVEGDVVAAQVHRHRRFAGGLGPLGAAELQSLHRTDGNRRCTRSITAAHAPGRGATVTYWQGREAVSTNHVHMGFRPRWRMQPSAHRVHTWPGPATSFYLLRVGAWRTVSARTPPPNDTRALTTAVSGTSITSSLR